LKALIKLRLRPSQRRVEASAVDEDKIDAVCKDGVLSITLPKAEKTKAVKVKVKG